MPNRTYAQVVYILLVRLTCWIVYSNRLGYVNLIKKVDNQNSMCIIVYNKQYITITNA